MGTETVCMVQYLSLSSDVVTIATTEKCLKQSTQQLDEEAQQLGLEINNGKTKYMINIIKQRNFGKN
jgi:hypothetical protein